MRQTCPWLKRLRYLAKVGVQVNDAVAESFHILRQQLVWVGDPVVQIAHFVVGEASGEED